MSFMVELALGIFLGNILTILCGLLISMIVGVANEM